MRTIHSKTRIAVLLCFGLLLVCTETLLAQRVQILNATNTLWRYHPNSTDPGYAPADAWVDPAFDDSTWSGPSRGLFGTEGAGIYPYPIVTPIPPPNGTAVRSFRAISASISTGPVTRKASSSFSPIMLMMGCSST